MEIISSRRYHGGIKAIILDWAGTTVDFGSFAPTAVFVQVFKSWNIHISVEHARQPMGLMKKDHLRAILDIPEVRSMWQEEYQRPPSETDINDMYETFAVQQIECIKEYARTIKGVQKMVTDWRRMGIKIGSTTGYTRAMMEVLVPEAKKNGYEPDAWVAADDLPAGRPFPWMCYQNAIELNVYPMEAMVKIGDTLADIDEGINAGMWTVGLAFSGNLLGKTETEFLKMKQPKLVQERELITKKFKQAGAHFVADGIWDCGSIIEDIQYRLEHGELPQN